MRGEVQVPVAPDMRGVEIVLHLACGHTRREYFSSGGRFEWDVSKPEFNVCSNECWDRLFRCREGHGTDGHRCWTDYDLTDPEGGDKE